ncbi:recombinase A [compost metagenome]
MYGIGISKEGGIVDIGVEMDIIDKSGAWFSYEGERLGQGRENAKQFLKDHPEISDIIEKKIREASNLTNVAILPTAQEEKEDELEEELLELE